MTTSIELLTIEGTNGARIEVRYENGRVTNIPDGFEGFIHRWARINEFGKERYTTVFERIPDAILKEHGIEMSPQFNLYANFMGSENHAHQTLGLYASRERQSDFCAQVKRLRDGKTYFIQINDAAIYAAESSPFRTHIRYVTCVDDKVSGCVATAPVESPLRSTLLES